MTAPAAAQDASEEEAPSETEAGDGEAGDGEAGDVEAGNVEAGNVQAGDEEERSARARELFTTGVGHAQEQRWAEAADAFREAVTLRSAASIRYNLAAALFELGEVREAHGQLLELEADPEAADNLRELSRQLHERIRSTYGRLRIELATELAGASVALDEELVSAEMLATAIPLRDGAHSVVAMRGPETVAETSVTTQAGDLTHVVLSVAAAHVEVPVEAPETSIAEEPLFWVGVGAGALVIAGVIVLAVVLSSSQSDTPPVEGNFQPGIITWP